MYMYNIEITVMHIFHSFASCFYTSNKRKHANTVHTDLWLSRQRRSGSGGRGRLVVVVVIAAATAVTALVLLGDVGVIT